MSAADADPWATQPLDTARALPAALYCDPAQLQRDRALVFARSWQLVAHAADLAGRGDHVPVEIAGVPLVLVRDDAGTLRALHNVCRHRAGPLAVCPGRGATSLRCRYHGWNYALDGQLKSATEMATAAAFDIAAIRLPQARVAQWQGLVFACLDDAAPALETVLAGVAERMHARDFSGMRFHQRVSYDIGCNWKTYVDNYLEGYHLPHVHPGLNRLLDYRQYRIETADWHSLQYSPLAADGPYDPGQAWYWFAWPNTMLNVLPGRLQTNRVLATGAQTCRVDFDFYYDAGLAPEALARLAAEDARFSDEVQREDIAICEQVQIGLASGSYVAGRINPLRENALHHFHELLRAAYRRGTTEANTPMSGPGRHGHAGSTVEPVMAAGS